VPYQGLFLCAHCAGDDAEGLIAACVEHLGPIPEGTNLGFVYLTDAVAGEAAAMVETLRRETGVPHWAGTVGMGVSAPGREYYDRPALSVMLTRLPQDAFRMVSTPLRTREASGEAAPLGQTDDPAYFGVLHGDPSNPALPAMIHGLAAELPEVFFVGGLTSSQGDHVQIVDGAVSGGLCGVLFTPEIPVVTGHTQGCTPISSHHVVTACQHNIIIELDGRPALHVFQEDIGEVLAKDLKRVAGYIFAGLPVPGSDTGDYLVRNLIGIDPNNGLLAIGEQLSTGDEIMFCRRDGNSARDDMRRMLEDIRRRLSAPPRGALYYSCVGRGRHQFGENSEELKLIQETLGDIPLTGFFANGEIFHSRLYGYTGVLSVFC
jgi:small ligand-binding sensory domain FIST